MFAAPSFLATSELKHVTLVLRLLRKAALIAVRVPHRQNHFRVVVVPSVALDIQSGRNHQARHEPAVILERLDKAPP